MKKVWAIALIVMLGTVVLGAISLSRIYNKLVQGDQAVKSAWAQVENVYQRRLDLIPNLVATVKGYAVHERETMQAVIEARSKISQMKITPELINDPHALSQFQAAQGQLSSTLNRLMVVVEQYPDLKANQNFIELQSQLEGTENRITVERKRYNEAAQSFNSLCHVFPNVLVARMMNFQDKEYFKAEEGANKPPKVEF